MEKSPQLKLTLFTMVGIFQKPDGAMLTPQLGPEKQRSGKRRIRTSSNWSAFREWSLGVKENRNRFFFPRERPEMFWLPSPHCPTVRRLDPRLRRSRPETTVSSSRSWRSLNRPVLPRKTLSLGCTALQRTPVPVPSGHAQRGLKPRHQTWVTPGRLPEVDWSC